MDEPFNGVREPLVLVEVVTQRAAGMARGRRSRPRCSARRRRLSMPRRARAPMRWLVLSYDRRRPRRPEPTRLSLEALTTANSSPSSAPPDRARRRPVTVHMIDIDRLRQINDTYGHDTDACSRRLNRSSPRQSPAGPDGDCLNRWNPLE